MPNFGVTGTTPARLSVGVISAGRVGTAFAAALERSGHVVSAVVARSAASQDRASQYFPDATIGEAVEVARRAELIVLAVPDTVLPAVVAELAESGAVKPGHIVAHTAGAVGWSILRPFAELGAIVIAAHPAMTFVGTEHDHDRMAGCFWAISAPGEVGIAVGQMLVMEAGGHAITVEESQRALYHAALAHGANHLVTLVNDAVDALGAALARHPDTAEAVVADSDPDGNAARLCAPLLRAALDNALARGDNALTGPVMRGDAVTVSRHLDVLEDFDDDLAAGYRALALRTAQRRGAGPEIMDLLNPDVTEQLR